MGTALADREGDYLALGELAPAVAGAEAGRPGDHQEHLLVGEVDVVGADGLTGRELVERSAEVLAAGLHSDPGLAEAESRSLFPVVEPGLEDVRHRQRPLNSGLRFSRNARIPSIRSSVAIASS
jgi:hypothetical protein